MSDLREVVANGPCPAEAALRMEAFEDAARARSVDLAGLSDRALEILGTAVHLAPYLALLLNRDPRRLLRVAADPHLAREKDRDTLAAELAARIALDPEPRSTPSLDRALRQVRADEMVRLGHRELTLGVPAEVGRELSRLAEVSFDAAIGHHAALLDAKIGAPLDPDGARIPFAVIGMGKLGGHELNFCSDVDVIYAYGSDDGAAGELSPHEYFSQLARAIGASLADVTDEDVVFRVDLRLRPEGSRGTIVNSLPSLERYYETFGRPWERQAWLKARASAGSLELGREVIDMLRPFTYPRSTTPEVVTDVRDLNRRIKAELAPRNGIETGYDVKNGVGGIREVEFFVQALQRIHGGRMPSIRSRTTVVALEQLLVAGLITDRERASLFEAYRFLRLVEHLLQLDSGRQTQRLPSAPSDVAQIAARLGLSSIELQAVLDGHSQRVAEIFETLGREDSELSGPVLALLSAELDAEGELRILGELGFSSPGTARQALERARSTPGSPLTPTASGAAARVAGRLLSEVVSSAAPDEALMHLTDLISRRGSWALIWRLLDQRPELSRLVVSLFATSEYLARVFIGNPELTDALMSDQRARPRRNRDDLETLLDERAGREDHGDPDEARWNDLAELKSSQVLRIGLADIAGELDEIEVCEELSLVADVCLGRGLDLVEAAVRERHGLALGQDGQPIQLAVLAMGKLGGEELGYASDLDVVFVYSGEGESRGPKPVDAVVYMTRVAQRLMSGLHALHPGGRIYELDTRLRPSGRGGLLVSSWPQWVRYHREEARSWERQALTKLRFVAGDPTLGKRIEDEVDTFLYGAPETDPVTLAGQVRAMRDKIETELGARIHGYDIKTGAGGLIDIEFAAQFLQLAHGHDHPLLRSRRTVEILRAAEWDRLAAPEALAILVDGYRFLRRLEHRMRIVHDRPVHKLPDDPGEIDRLARRLGYDGGRALRSAFEDRTAAIRGAYSAILGGA